jgi:S-adenosyl-L-methionine methyltransferase
MSRLDSMIARLTAQRLCLNHAAALIRPLPGVVLEVGLGNGRTFSHVREQMPDRQIYVFDRAINAHPDCRPTTEYAFLGQIEDTLPLALARFRGGVALVHADVGDGTSEYGQHMAGVMNRNLPGHLSPGAVVACDQQLSLPGANRLTIPGLADGQRYFLYQWA